MSNIVLLSTIAKPINTIASTVILNHDFVTLSLLPLLVMHAVCHHYYCDMYMILYVPCFFLYVQAELQLNNSFV